MTFPTFLKSTIGILFVSSPAFAVPTLSKLHDFNNAIPNIGVQNPYDTAVLVGSELWFTSQNGGASGFGTFASFDLATNLPTIRVSMDNASGNTPNGNPTLNDGLLHYTTTRGGTGDRGTLNAYNISTSNNSVLWNSPSNSPATNPNTLPGNVAIIDRGILGKDIYFLTGSGGSGGAGIGTIQRYQTHDASVTQVHAFAAAPDARQPFKGFTVVGTILYFTTFTGGNTGTGATNGAGTLNELDVSTRGAEIYRKLANMPLGDGSTRFPAHNPYYRAADHCLYFTTAGTSTQPGSLQKFDLSTEVLTTLYELQGAATASGPFPDGRFAYGSVSEWNRTLYFTTIQGGANAPVGSTAGGGTINRYHLDTGIHEVMFNLDISTGNNHGGEARGGFTYNGSATFPYFYLLTRQGGVNDHGTVLRLNLDPPLPAPAYTEWIATFPSISGSLAIPNADADSDGLTNREEFAFGTHPNSGSDSTVSSGRTLPEGFEIRWTARSDSSVSYVLQASSTLGAAPSPWATAAGTIETLSSPDIPIPSGYERRRAIVPSSEASRFYRVKANFAPGALP
jgi:uncharacterized repeat protein (TIGR03803 family)